MNWSAHFVKEDVINPYLSSGPVHPYQLAESISNFKGDGVLFHFILF